MGAVDEPRAAAGEMRTRRLDYLTGPAIEAYLARSDAAILAVGPTETHGPDVHTATIAGRHVFERTGRPVAVHHAVPGRGTTARERELGDEAQRKDRDNAGFGETSRLMAALEVLELPAELVDTVAVRRGPARGSPLPAALTEPMRAGGAGFFYTELSQHIPTPSAYSVAEGRAYLDAAAAAIAESLAAMRQLGSAEGADHAA